MERLTEWFFDHWGTTTKRINGKIVGNKTCINKLAEYENAEEQGLLLRLPCPLGTKIYCIHNGFVEEGMFFEMSCFKFKDYYNKSWFLTKEEAEQALEQKGE